MPAFKFKCSTCNEYFMKLLETKVSAFPCKCGGEGVHQLTSSSSTTVMETRDRYHGKAVRRGVEKQIRERFNEHNDRYDLEERIDKHGMDDAVRHGWLKKVKKI